MNRRLSHHDKVDQMPVVLQSKLKSLFYLIVMKKNSTMIMIASTDSLVTSLELSVERFVTGLRSSGLGIIGWLRGSEIY